MTLNQKLLLTQSRQDAKRGKKLKNLDFLCGFAARLRAPTSG
jgi:hypothetical protein